MITQRSFPAILAFVLTAAAVLVVPMHGHAAPLFLATPYAQESDMASINEAFSDNDCAPWEFEHQGIDFFPAGDLMPFQAACSGTVDKVEKFFNYGNGKWQVNIAIICDPTYRIGYAFEPMSSNEDDADNQMANIFIVAGQNVSQGDVVGDLHTAGSGAHVHFDLMEHGQRICPAPFFTKAAADSILTLLHTTWPHARMCYGPTASIPTATIFLDGNTADWYGVSPIAADRYGDSSPAYSGDDAQAFYLAKNATHLFLRLDLWEDANTSFGNGPAPREGRYSFHLGNGGPYPNLYLSVAHDEQASQWSLGLNGSNGPGAPAILQGPGYVGVQGGVIEVGFPLSTIGYPTRFEYVRAEVVSCCVDPGPPAILDETHCVMNLALTRSPTKAIRDLMLYVRELPLSRWIKSRLTRRLESTMRSLAWNRRHSAARKMTRFIRYVRALKGRGIPAGEADNLIARAKSIVEALRSS